MENIKAKDKWAEKYIKDSIWFPFGSILNAWANIKKEEKGYTMEQFLVDIDDIYKKAQEKTVETYQIYEKIELVEEPDNSPDIQTRT